MILRTAVLWIGAGCLTLAMACGDGKGCGQKSSSMGVVKEVYKALSYLNLDAETIQEVKVAAEMYRKEARMLQSSMTLPYEALTDNEINKKAFLQGLHNRHQELFEARYEFIDTIYVLLNQSQKQQFVKELRAQKFYQSMMSEGMGCKTKKQGCNDKKRSSGCAK